MTPDPLNAHPDPCPPRPRLTLVPADPRPAAPALADLVHLSARLLVTADGAIARLRRGHTPDPSGHCRAHVDVRTRWPCHAVLVAEEVARMRRNRSASRRGRG